MLQATMTITKVDPDVSIKQTKQYGNTVKMRKRHNLACPSALRSFLMSFGSLLGSFSLFFQVTVAQEVEAGHWLISGFNVPSLTKEPINLP